ncbi:MULTISPECIES: CHAD domain-containing protein [unclassified Caballeronia]|uniref:CHAD domain-containing protein n=1 Tax=unclassified Caballeronia TaxID=2646786 RepID=UPI002857EBC0|nr:MULTISPECIES: CHAD domain-containing protein [unclassified Caballeronia]MDR5740628.1 CHAD domain-containing protein [Caballeronia sp. LZ016]MDR5808849.1 CHAD domain-containing protein [Caballeronia sp. LZ019]
MKKTDADPHAHRDDSAETSFSAYAGPLVGEAIAEAATLEAAADAEKLHKLRVALRRLRTLIWAYGPILDAEFGAQQRAIYKFLANAAGNTRDWDILIQLVEATGDRDAAESFRKDRAEASERSLATLSHANVKQVLREAVSEANRELNTAAKRTPLVKFARKRVAKAQKQLEKRMRAASKAKRNDYESFHDVRKTGKKVRYLVEFFEPLIGEKQRRGLKKLKQIQKRFGALNDVVATRSLLEQHRSSSINGAAAERALRALKKEQKRRFKAAAKLL